MGLFDRHIDARISDWSAGELSPAASRRMVDHARACPRCDGLLNRAMLAQRALHGDLRSPSEAERQLWSAGASKVVAQSLGRSEPLWNRGWFAGLATAAVAASVAVFALRPTAEPEFSPRGDHQTQQATMRVYCTSPSSALVELEAAGSCPTGGTLGFAVGARAPLGQVRLSVVQQGAVLSRETFAVAGQPGEEDVLPLSLPLKAPGTVQVEAVFAGSTADLEGSTHRLLRTVEVR